MKSQFTAISLLALIATLSGCVSVSDLPQTSSAVNFESAEGKSGWSAYRQTLKIQPVAEETIFQAAKAGLGDAGFQLRHASKENGAVIGEHGMTAHDWNVVAGVYYRKSKKGWDVAILVEGSKDVGFSGDATGDAWTAKIAKGMRVYLILNSEASKAAKETPESPE